MSFVAAAHADISPTTTITCNKPTGTVDNDYMLAFIKRVSEAAPTGVPSGWTLLADNPVGGSNSLWLYGKLASSEGADYTWTWADSLRTGITIATYRGDFDTADPIDVVSDTVYTTSNTTVRAASVSAAAANSVIVFAGAVHGSAAVTFTAPSAPASFSENVDTQGDGSGRFSRTFARLAWSGSGATGDMDATASATATDKHAFAVVFNPPAASYTITVDSTGLALGAQSVGLPMSMGVTYQGLTLGASNVTLIFDQAYTVPVTHTPLALEGQELPFILTQPGTAGQLALQGQTVNLTWTGNYTMPVTAGEMALAGQTITFSFADSRVIVVDSGSLVFGGSEVGLTIPFVSGGGMSRTNRGRRYFKMFNVGR